jgi:hypothetical protein
MLVLRDSLFCPLSELAVSPSDDIVMQVTASENKTSKELVYRLDDAYGLLVLVFDPSLHPLRYRFEGHPTPAMEPLHHRVRRALTAVEKAVAALRQTAGTAAGKELEEHSREGRERCTRHSA